MKRYYTVKETAKILKVSTNTVYSYLANGSLQGKRLGETGRFKIPLSQLEPYLTENENPKDEKPAQVLIPPSETPTGSEKQNLNVKPVLSRSDSNGKKFPFVFEMALGVFSGLIAYSLMTYAIQNPKMDLSIVKEVASETLSYSERSSEKFEDMVVGETPELMAGLIKTSEGIIKVLNKNKYSGDTNGIAYNPKVILQEEITQVSPAPVVNILGTETVNLDKKVVIEEISSGWLLVRNAPGGTVIGRVQAGGVYNLLGEQSGWYQIERNASESGWISSDYAKIQ